MTAELLLVLSGASHDGLSWPLVKIKVNNNLVWQGKVLENLYVPYEMTLQDINTLEIEHYGKMFGENGIWHTSSQQDRNVTLKKLVMGGVDVQDLLHLGQLQNTFNQKQLDDFANSNQAVPHTKQFVHMEPIFMGYNSTYRLQFPRDIYDWIIVQKSPLMRPFDPKKESSLNSVNWRLDWINSHEVVDIMQDIQSLLADYRCKH